MNGLYIPKFKMLRFNIIYNKIEIHIEISIKKLQLNRGD
jgi:hypothetical protein